MKKNTFGVYYTSKDGIINGYDETMATSEIEAIAQVKSQIALRLYNKVHKTVYKFNDLSKADKERYGSIVKNNYIINDVIEFTGNKIGYEGESMKTNESKVNQNFDQTDTWRTTILNSVEDKDSVQFKVDETNNQELAIQNEAIIGIFDNDLKCGTIVENNEQTFSDQESWMQSLGSDPVTIDQDDEGQVVVAKNAQGQVIGTYTTVNGQGKGVTVESNGNLVFLGRDRATWVDDNYNAELFSKSEAEDLASKLGGTIMDIGDSDKFFVVKRVLEDDSDNTAGINYAELKLESKQTVLDLVAKFNALSSELEHKYKIGQANSNPNAQVEFQKLNNAVQKLLSEINNGLKLLGFKDNELYKPNTTNINLRIISKKIDNFVYNESVVAQSDQSQSREDLIKYAQKLMADGKSVDEVVSDLYNMGKLNIFQIDSFAKDLRGEKWN